MLLDGVDLTTVRRGRRIGSSPPRRFGRDFCGFPHFFLFSAKLSPGNCVPLVCERMRSHHLSPTCLVWIICPTIPPLAQADDHELFGDSTPKKRTNREQIQHRLDLLLRRLYGPRSERINPDQLLLFADLLAAAEPQTPVATALEDPLESVPVVHKAAVMAVIRSLLNARIPVLHDLTEAEKACTIVVKSGHQDRRRRPNNSITVLLLIIRHLRPKYACGHCCSQVAAAVKPATAHRQGAAGTRSVGSCRGQQVWRPSASVSPRTNPRAFWCRALAARPCATGWAVAEALASAALYQSMIRSVLASRVIHTDDRRFPCSIPSWHTPALDACGFIWETRSILQRLRLHAQPQTRRPGRVPQELSRLFASGRFRRLRRHLCHSKGGRGRLSRACGESSTKPAPAPPRLLIRRRLITASSMTSSRPRPLQLRKLSAPSRRTTSTNSCTRNDCDSVPSVPFALSPSSIPGSWPSKSKRLPKSPWGKRSATHSISGRRLHALTPRRSCKSTTTAPERENETCGHWPQELDVRRKRSRRSCRSRVIQRGVDLPTTWH